MWSKSAFWFVKKFISGKIHFEKCRFAYNICILRFITKLSRWYSDEIANKWNVQLPFNPYLWLSIPSWSQQLPRYHIHNHPFLHITITLKISQIRTPTISGKNLVNGLPTADNLYTSAPTSVITLTRKIKHSLTSGNIFDCYDSYSFVC